MATHRIVFQPSGRQGTTEDNTTILEAARALGVGIENICGGRQTCAKCRVSIAEGHFPKYNLISTNIHVTPLAPSEQDYRVDRTIRADERLACVACVRGDVVVNVPPEAQAQKQVVRKSASVRAIDIDPVVRQVYVEVIPAQIGDRRSDLERLQVALYEQWKLDDVQIDAKVIPTLGKVLRSGNWKVTVTLWQDREIIRVKPGYAEGIVGLAVDLGTTTIAGYLCDLRTGELLATETQMNPQIVYGEDLMSRVTYGMMNADGAEKLHRVVIRAVNEVANSAAKQVKLRAEDIVDMVVVGNPIMMHLFLGIDPVELGGAPFALTIRDPLDLKARDMGVKLNAGATLHTLPMQAGHVGADASAVALAESLHTADVLTLAVDVGTNAEILLGDRHGVYAASSPTGPAFEGAQILHGQRAAPGAIERVRIDPVTLVARFKIIGQERWSDELPSEQLSATGICGSGIIEVIAEMFLTGIIGGDGRFVAREHSHPRVQVSTDGRKAAYILATAEQTASGSPILITQDDVRAIQLAKAALYAGIKLLLQHYRADRGDTLVKRILLAGAFGTYIDPKYAMVLGLIPDCALEQVFAVGNSAGDGARIALLNKHQRLEVASLARKINYVETATDAGFQNAFVDAIHIPNAADLFPHLGSVLPNREVQVKKRRTVTVRSTDI